MLQEVKIAGVASYSVEGQSLSGLRPLNFIFGTNGSGKTTISRVIADPSARPTCSLTWASGHEMECLVYNSDFASNNFAHRMRGIFTLGQTEGDTLDRIAAASQKVRSLNADIAALENALGPEDQSSGKRAELRLLRASFETFAWTIKTAHDPYFQDAFSGFRNSRSSFCDKILLESAENTSILVPLADLQRRATTIFAKGLNRVAPLPQFDAAPLITLEQAPVLAKKIVGKEDIDIAALISRLGNSDWVRQGRTYATQAGSVCPYCQQEVSSDLTRMLDDYFDETYLNDLADIDQTHSAYAATSTILMERFEEIAASQNPYLDTEAFRADIDRFKSKVETNLRQLERKRKEASSQVSLESLSEIVTALSRTSAAVNSEVNTHNQMVDNLAHERSTLISQVWKCLVEGSRHSFDEYTTRKTALDRAVSGLMAGLAQKRAALIQASAELAELEKSVTSVEPTVTEINSILRSFGFTGFELATAGEHRNLYEIIRGDGSAASTTLSEGERSFITFLYFYHLLKGSMSSSGISADRVVVFDDPVSSLDSDVLFIVSALIRRIVEEACAGNGQIKQVFLLTHNIYFHKEVSFDHKRGKECRAHETFWIVRKTNNETKVINYDHNPISTSYELLWREVTSPERSKTTIQNTLRRILENYFKILGNIDKDTIIEQFEGRDQLICMALFSWVNDGSHSFNDDLYVSTDDAVIVHYLDVFRRIFEVSQHTAHYEMMMGPEAIAAMAQARQLASTDGAERAA